MENMGLGYGGTGSSPAQYGQANMIHMPTLKQRLDTAVKDAEARLEDAKRARALLDKNPDLEELLNIMQKGRF